MGDGTDDIEPALSNGLTTITSRTSIQPLPLFLELEAASQRLVGYVNALPQEDRRGERQRLRNIATLLRKEAKSNANRASTANSIGGVLGGGLLVGTIALFVTSPISIPLVAIAAASGGVFAVGLAAGHRLAARGIEQEHRAELVDNMIEEIDR